MNPLAYYSHYPQMTPLGAKRLGVIFGSEQNHYPLDLETLVRFGWEEKSARALLSWSKETPEEKLLDQLQRQSIKTVSLNEPGYPELLKNIPDPPLTLFYRGLIPEDYPAVRVAIVGTRQASPYGLKATEGISAELARVKAVIVSGLALGIDGVAHTTTLDVGGVTIAVLGCGVDNQTIYPKQHTDLAEAIIAGGGAVLSEYPPGFGPKKYTFPARNRIIAGLSHITVVTEAPEHSGALITAYSALDYNREVAALPHAVTNLSGRGGNLLIKRGAALVENAMDILATVNGGQTI